MYNQIVPMMQTVDPSLKFSAVELADFGSEEQNFIPTFLAGVTAQVDVLSTHFYSTCNQKDSDQQVFGTVPGFATGVEYLHSQLQGAGLTAVPVWITENNVNADFDADNGMSARAIRGSRSCSTCADRARSLRHGVHMFFRRSARQAQARSTIGILAPMPSMENMTRGRALKYSQGGSREQRQRHCQHRQPVLGR